MQQKFPRMSDGHAWKISKLEKKLKKTKHVLGHAWIFFFKEKKKEKLEKKTMYVHRTWVEYFFNFFFFAKKIFHKSPMNMVGYFFHQKKNKNTEKNTHACLWNIRGSLPLLKKNSYIYDHTQKQFLKCLDR